MSSVSAAQHQLDTRAIELATRALSDTEKNYLLLTGHIASCAKMQRAQLGGVIILLIGMLGVLINLYVLPQRVVTNTITTETLRTIPAPQH